MFKTNVCRLDRALRIVAGVILALIGLFPLGGWQGHGAGVDLILFALWPLATGRAGSCGLYRLFGISTVGKSRDVPPQAAFKAKD
jgi:hypothetical protein